MGAPIFEEIPQGFIDEVKTTVPDRKKLIEAFERGDANEINHQFAVAMDWKLDPGRLYDMLEEGKIAELTACLRPYGELRRLRNRWDDRYRTPLAHP